MIPDAYSGHTDLTDDVGASVTVYNHAKFAVNLSAGGDLSISIGYITPARARELARLLNEAASVAEQEQLPSWLSKDRSHDAG